MGNLIADVHRESLMINGTRFWIQDVRDLTGKVEFGIFVADEDGRHFYLRANSRSSLIEKIRDYPYPIISPLEYSLRKSGPPTEEEAEQVVIHRNKLFG